MIVLLESPSMLNINLTYSMAEAISVVLSRLQNYTAAFGRESLTLNQTPIEDIEVMTRSDFHYRLKNRIGIPV
jgi:hypothetical protein